MSNEGIGTLEYKLYYVQDRDSPHAALLFLSFMYVILQHHFSLKRKANPLKTDILFDDNT